MQKAEVISYPEVKQIIEDCADKRTQALLAFQYAMGNRAGELAKTYKHTVRKKKRGKGLVKIGTFTSDGIRRDQFFETEDGLEWESPNFKNKSKPTKRAWVMKSSEQWLYDILKEWLDSWKPTPKNVQTYLFDIKETRIKGLVDTELKMHNEHWHSHCLRHSRATHIGEITGDIFVVQEVLGHGRMETSRRYISIAKQRLKQKLGSRSFEDVLGRRV